MPRYIDADKAGSIENLDDYSAFAAGVGDVRDVQDVLADATTADAAPVVHGRYCIDIVDFIDWLDVGHLRSADEKCFSEANVAGMLKDFAITNPAIPATVTRCKDCRYGLPCKLFGRDAITCTEHREEIHLMDWYCADAAKTDGKDDAK